MMKRFFSNLGRSPNQSSGSKPVTLRWIITNQLAIGPLPTPAAHPVMLKGGIKAVLSLCAEEEGQLPPQVCEDFQWTRLVLPDSHYQEALTVDHVSQAVEIVRSAIVANLPIYVHCLAAMERSPTICTAYLCKYEGMELWEALNLLKQVNPRTNLNTDQVQVIQQYMKQ